MNNRSQQALDRSIRDAGRAEWITATTEAARVGSPVVQYLPRLGYAVLAKEYAGKPSAIGYANRTQAERSASHWGGEVVRRGRPFYVRLSQPITPLTGATSTKGA